MAERTLSLVLPQMRLDFSPVDGAGGYGYGLSVRTADTSDWRRVSAANNPLVRGSSFNLYPAEAQRQDDSTILLRGTRRVTSDQFDYAYSATVQADARRNWFRFE